MENRMVNLKKKKLTSLQKIMICKITRFQFSWILLVCKSLIFTQKIWALTPHITLTRKALKFTSHHQTVHYTENDTAKPHFTYTHLIQTPSYTEQFSLSLGKVSPYIFSKFNLLNPLSPNIHIEILQTDLHTFSWRISWENLVKDQIFFYLRSFC